LPAGLVHVISLEMVREEQLDTHRWMKHQQSLLKTPNNHH